MALYLIHILHNQIGNYLHGMDRFCLHLLFYYFNYAISYQQKSMSTRILGILPGFPYVLLMFNMLLHLQLSIPAFGRPKAYRSLIQSFLFHVQEKNRRFCIASCQEQFLSYYRRLFQW